MSDSTGQTGAPDVPPVSSFQDSVQDLLQHRLLEPPVCPGLLANLDGYEILRVIGLGGMGLVLLARDPGRKEPVAIKLIRPELAGESRSVQRFLAEARHMRQFRHEGIVPVLAISDSPKKPYFVMPFLGEANLADLLKAGRPLDAPVVLRIALRVAGALAYAHGKGIIHRDLKPANVLLNEKGEACLTDFGLARDVFNEAISDINREHREGTAAYMSPAVAVGKAEDTRCDIYGFGAVLYEMLTGQPPYQGKTSKEILEKVRTGPPAPIRQIKPDAPVGLTTVAEAAMARELRDRYSEMADVVRDLERVAAAQKPLGSVRGSDPAVRSQAKSPFRAKVVWVGGFAVVIALVALATWPGNHRAESGKDPTVPVAGGRDSTTLANGLSVTGEGLSVMRRIEFPGIWNWSPTRVGRWEGHPEPLLFLPYDNRLVVLSSSGRVVFESAPLDPRAERMQLRFLKDLLGHSSDDAIVSWRSGRHVCLSVLNHNLKEMKRFTAEGRWEVKSTGEAGLSEIECDWIGDLDGDGRQELLAQVGTPWTNAIRGLYCFDFESTELRWRYLTGPYLHEATPVDLDGDGTQEILLGSAAVDNHHSADDGTDDSHSYLYAFEADGRLRWVSALGGPLTFVHPLVTDADGDGREEIFAWLDGAHELWLNEGRRELGPVFRFDRKGNTTHEVDLGARLFSCQAVDLDADGRKELFATDRLGNLHVLDAELRVLSKTQIVTPRFDQVVLRLAAVADLDDDGRPELLLTSCQAEFVAGLGTGTPTGPRNVRRFHDRQLLVLNAQLATVASLRVGEHTDSEPHTRIEVLDVDGDGRKEILWLGLEALILRLTR